MLVLPMLSHAEAWIEHPQFVAAGIQNNIDTDANVYMLVGNRLSRFDKATTDIQQLTTTSGLSQDMIIKQIYYNYDKKYLFVVYINSNIDVIKDDGSVVNLPALFNYTLQGIDKTVNDVTFGAGSVYVSTGFGYLIIDDTTLEVKQYKNFGKSFTSVLPMGNSLIAAIGDSLYYSPTLMPLKFGDFKAVAHLSETTTATSKAKLYGINDTRFFLTTTADKTYVYRMEIQAEEDSVGVTKYQYSNTFTAAQPLLNIQPTPTGFLWNVLTTNKTFYTTNEVGENYKAVNGKNNGIYSCNPAGDGTLWGLGATGLFKNSASTTLYTSNAITIARPYWASYNPNNGKLYLTCTAATAQLPTTNEAGCMVYDGEHWTSGGFVFGPDSPTPVKATAVKSGWRQLFDLTKPNTKYVGTWWHGMFKLVNDTATAIYDERNSPIVAPKNYYRCVQGYGFDSQHNLWLVESDDVSGGNAANNPVLNAAMVLPADKLEKDTITADDWYSYNIPGTVGITSSKFSWLAIGRGDVKVYTPGNGGAGKNYLLCWRGALDSEQEVKQHNTVVDQLGASTSCGLNPVLAADSTGMVWVGGSGVFYFDPTTAFGETLNVTRPRTTTGDIILSGVAVTHIEVDHLNRKWVSSSNDGVYLLNADGTEILQHFDGSNSPMPSNLVYSTCAMGNTGHVMIITSNGVVEYIEGDTDAETTVTEFSVYPSLVLPQFTGLVTITGVTSGSTVRIADRDGNTVANLTAGNGNIATWDACNSNGERVQTGIYGIYTETAGEPMPDAPQAYVKVVK